MKHENDCAALSAAADTAATLEKNDDSSELVLLAPEKVHFKREQSGYLTLEYAGKTYEIVTLTRLIPFESDETYISVSFNNAEDEWTEIGVLRSLEELPAAEAECVRGYLAFKYYIPEITKIHKIADNRMGYLFLEAETTAGEKKIAVSDWWHNFRFLPGRMLAVTDADGNRYRITNVDTLDKASYKRLLLFI